MREPAVNYPLPAGNSWWKRLADATADGLCAIIRAVIALLRWQSWPW
jgi:hypothetical protein